VAGLTAASGLWVAVDLRGGRDRADEGPRIIECERMLAGAKRT